MKTRNLLSSIGLGIITLMLTLSCTKEASEVLISKEKVEIIANPFAISEKQAIEKASALMDMNLDIQSERTDGKLTETIGVYTRSSEQGSNRQASVSAKNYGVKVEKSSGAGREIRQEIPVYTINYKDENGKGAGFVVMAGDERISGDLLIYSDFENAFFDMEQREDADFLEDLIAGYLYKSINIEAFNNPATTRGTLSTTNIGGVLTQILNYPIIFGQNDDPYIKYTPFSNSTSYRCMTGPVATAMSQIMAWHEWPTQGTFPRYTTYSSSPVTQIVNASYVLTPTQLNILRTPDMQTHLSDSIVAKYIGNLLVETGYRLNSAFGSIATLADPVDAIPVFEEMGYKSNQMVINTYAFSTVKNDISLARPVFMWGTGSYPGLYYTTFAYVVYGVRTDSNTSEDYIFLTDGHVNLNYAFAQTGAWFNAKAFSINNDNIPGYTISISFPYKYNCKTITNIEKNPSKNGSTNPSWRVRSVNPY